MLSDSTIWNDFKKGKSYALSYIYCRNVELLYHYGRKFSHYEALIKDTIQEIFYRLIRTRTSLGETDNIRFYSMIAFKHGEGTISELADVEIITYRIEKQKIFVGTNNEMPMRN